MVNDRPEGPSAKIATISRTWFGVCRILFSPGGGTHGFGQKNGPFFGFSA
jgi:hypothetical protein